MKSPIFSPALLRSSQEVDNLSSAETLFERLSTYSNYTRQGADASTDRLWLRSRNLPWVCADELTSRVEAEGIPWQKAPPTPDSLSLNRVAVVTSVIECRSLGIVE